MSPLASLQDGADVLVVEDDPKIVELLELHLGDIGLSTEAASSGNRGLKRALEAEYRLVILDLMLPGLDGFEVCKRIRAEKGQLPILMLTAKSEELDKVLGLELGADDYITKPFSIRELLARVKAVLRRTAAFREGAAGTAGQTLEHGDLRIDLEKRTVTVGGKKIELTAKEYDLLVLFASSPGRAFNRQQLLDSVWGYQFEGYHHTVNSHINRLRSKIEENPAEPRYIKTVWGYGYRFVEAEEP
jgi:two-component system, OmpR family, alkaline phosphatase synthesis response regulator PhoP